MAQRIPEQAASVIGFSEAIKKTCADLSKTVLDFDPKKITTASWDVALAALDQISDLTQRATAKAAEGREACQPELDLRSGPEPEPEATEAAAPAQLPAPEQAAEERDPVPA